MPCTTILVGKKASYDGSTIIARNDDGGYTTKKLVLVKPKEGAITYTSKIAHLKIEIKDKAMAYTMIPNVSKEDGIWGTAGINEANVGMSASETITSNALVLGADPYVRYIKAKGKQKETAGGIGEEDLVSLVLPYIKSAREGVERLGALLEKYGTYEPNGIAFNDEKECWYLETIGGHHWMALRCEDDKVIIMPNQLGIDHFDLQDAYGKKKNYLCSKDLKKFIDDNHLDLNMQDFNPRNIFGSHSDGDHIYNTPRAWDMGRFLCPTKYKWYGENADYTLTSDNIPFAFIPERKLTIEDVKYILSSHYQATKYNPYQKADYPEKGMYRVIGTGTTDDLAILQIRPYMPEKLKAIEWISFCSNPFNALCPYYPMGENVPDYLTKVEEKVDTNNLFWSSRLIGALSDAHYSENIMHITRYQGIVASRAHELINKYDQMISKKKDYALINEANSEFVKMIKEETDKTLYNILKTSTEKMKNRFNRGDN